MYAILFFLSVVLFSLYHSLTLYHFLFLSHQEAASRLVYTKHMVKLWIG